MDPENFNTPKKFYEKRAQSTGSISRCRLCNSVTDKKYSKNLYRAQNRSVLLNAERFYGGELPQNDSLPHLICAPCERRLNNAVKFKEVVQETQRVLREDVHAKRCISIYTKAACQSPFNLFHTSTQLGLQCWRTNPWRTIWESYSSQTFTCKFILILILPFSR